MVWEAMYHGLTVLHPSHPGTRNMERRFASSSTDSFGRSVQSPEVCALYTNNLSSTDYRQNIQCVPIRVVSKRSCTSARVPIGACHPLVPQDPGLV